MPQCLICRKELKYISIGSYDGKEYNHIESGGAVIIYCFYGSEFDTEQYESHICDDCIKERFHVSDKR